MGNLTSHHSKCCSLSLRDMDALGKNTKLNNEEIKDYYNIAKRIIHMLVLCLVFVRTLEH